MLIAFQYPASAKYLFYSDGSIIECEIIRQTATSVTIKRKGSRRAEVIKGNDIIRLREKINIRENIIVYDKARGIMRKTNLVDEGDLSYAFRDDLRSPNEFTVKKQNAQFIEGTFDTTFAGKPVERGISLSWSEVPNAVDWVAFYAAKDDLISYAGYKGNERPTEVIFPKGKTEYHIRLCVFDDNGNSLGLSNEFVFTTGNFAPDPPSSVSLTALYDGALNDHLITWNDGLDSDGKVAGYKVYADNGGGYHLVAETKKRDWHNPDNFPASYSSYYVTTIDDDGAESIRSQIVCTRKPVPITLSVFPVCGIPFLSMRNDYSYGAGALFRIDREDFFLKNFSLGVTTGVIRFKGSGSKADYFPFQIEASWRYYFSRIFYTGGSVGCGTGYWGGEIDSITFRHFPVTADLYALVGVKVSERTRLELGSGAGVIYSAGSLLTRASVRLGVSTTIKL